MKFWPVIRAAFALLVAISALLLHAGTSRADDPVVVNSFELRSRWPSGATVTFSATAPNEIVSVIANVTSGKGRASVTRRPSITPGMQVSGSFDAPSSGAPPFGEIAVQLTFQEANGNQTRTEWKRVRYIDARY